MSLSKQYTPMGCSAINLAASGGRQVHCSILGPHGKAALPRSTFLFTHTSAISQAAVFHADLAGRNCSSGPHSRTRQFRSTPYPPMHQTARSHCAYAQIGVIGQHSMSRIPAGHRPSTFFSPLRMKQPKPPNSKMMPFLRLLQTAGKECIIVKAQPHRAKGVPVMKTSAETPIY